MVNLFLTIFSGVTIYVLGQIIVKMFIEPVQEMKKTIARIKMDTHRYSHIIVNSSVIEESDKKETSEILRNLSAELIAHIELIPRYKNTAKLFGLPGQKKVTDASVNLIALSNWINYPDNTHLGQRKIGYILDNFQKLQENLNFQVDQESRLDAETIKNLKM